MGVGAPTMGTGGAVTPAETDDLGEAPAGAVSRQRPIIVAGSHKAMPGQIIRMPSPAIRIAI